MAHTANCDLRSVSDAARRYLSQPERNQVGERLRALEREGCTGATSETLAWEILVIVENVFVNGLGGAPSHGAALVNGVLHCCVPGAAGDVVSERSLSPGGAFGVRGSLPSASPAPSDGDPVVSRGAVDIAFVLEGGEVIEPRPGVLVVRPADTGTWSGVAKGAVTLIHASPNGPGPQHTSFTLNESPKLGLDDPVDVIVCFVDSPPGNGAGDPDFAARIQRNGVLIPGVPDAVAFCESLLGNLAMEAAPSLFASLRQWAARHLLPGALYAAVEEVELRSTRGLGGSASDFSEFAIVNALAGGALTWVTAPPPVVPSTSFEFPLEVRAESGGGSPVAGVEITLSIHTNMGAPAEIIIGGTFVDCGGNNGDTAVACTDEERGIALFEDVSITKAGGYILCANASAGGFSFPVTCTERFHVRN